MNIRTRAAVSACARTLAEAHDADALVALSDAVTIGPLRAFADRVALRRRFHDQALDLHHRPPDAAAAALYDALHLARLDALGVAWLAGVAANLLAHPGVEDDGVRWLAFESFATRDAPKEKCALVARTQRDIDRSLLEDLRGLAQWLGDQQAFSPAARSWSMRASGHVPAPLDRPVDQRFNIPDRPSGDDVRRGRYALPGRTETAGQNRGAAPDEDGTHSAPARARETLEAIGGYRVFTRAFDRVVNAAALASRDDLARLRLQLDADFSPMRSMVARLSKRLMRVLMAKQAREWRFDLDEGLLDPSRLPVYVASGGAARPFKLEFESPFPSTVVSLLIDHSGSMTGRPMRIAALTVEVFVRVLERCGVACEVLGFTTRDWDGGEPGRQWAAAGYPEAPGRLNALEHIVIKAAGVPWRRARPALGLFLHDEMLKENIDGEALAWAHERLVARSERRRILVVVSDGAPMDEATCAANGFDYLDAHLAAVVRAIETRSPVKLAAIGIGHDVSQFYRNATRITRMDDLGPALAAKLTNLLDESA